MFFSKSGGVKWLVVFLGNPGLKYEHTRHNAGFMTADALEKIKGVKINRSRFKALTATVDMGGESVYETDTNGAVGLVLGSEGDGISRLVREKCDFIISIPMFGKLNSMNVSCAAAVLLANIANKRKGG